MDLNRRRRPFHLLLLVLWSLSPSKARAEEVPDHFTPVRATGMGGAFTAVANDQSAVWTNPAGIARVRKARSRSTFHLTKVPHIIAGGNAESRTFYEGYKAASDKSVEELVTGAGELGDKPFWARAGLFPVTLFDMGRGHPSVFGLYANSVSKIIIEKDTPAEARSHSISDVGAVLGFALTNRTNRFNVGLQFRPVYRYAYEERFPSEDLLKKKVMAKRIQQGANQSQGLGIDFGMLYTIADFWFPTIGVSVLNLPTGCRKNYLNPFTEKPENVCGNVFTGDFANEDALSVVDPTDIRVGVSILPRLTRKIALRFALDVHHIPVGSEAQSYGLQGIEASKLIHGGVELHTGNPLRPSPFSLRAGYSQGFATWGASINLPFFSVEFASYGRDISSTNSAREDRRYLASMSFDF